MNGAQRDGNCFQTTDLQKKKRTQKPKILKISKLGRLITIIYKGRSRRRWEVSRKCLVLFKLWVAKIDPLFLSSVAILASHMDAVVVLRHWPAAQLLSLFEEKRANPKPQEKGSAPQSLTTLLEPPIFTSKEGPYPSANRGFFFLKAGEYGGRCPTQSQLRSAPQPLTTLLEPYVFTHFMFI